MIATPAAGNTVLEGVDWCADNGCFTPGRYPGDARYLAWLARHAAHAARCAFAAAPDVVGDAAATLARSVPMLPRIRTAGFRAALVAQDGLERLRVPWELTDALFLGGSTGWKLGPAAADFPLTEDRFPAGERQRWYRTGDMVRDVGDGMLEFAGRNGGYLKVRGFRIEPGEIVAAVTAYPGITDAAVVAVDTPHGQTVVCAVVRSPGDIVSELELRRYLGHTLPSYMRPGRIVFVGRLPRLSSGKLDSRALRHLVEERTVSAPTPG